MFPKRKCTSTLSKPLRKRQSRCILRKWKQSTKKEDEWNSFVRKLAGWHLEPLPQNNFFTYNFEGFYINDRLRKTTSRSCTKCLKSACEIIFYRIWWLKFWNLYMKLTVFRRSSLKHVIRKTSSKFTSSKKQLSGGVAALLKRDY